MRPPSGKCAMGETRRPPANTGQAYSFTVHASGGTPPYHWRLNGATIPSLTIDFNSGLISGTTPSACTFSLPVTASDGTGTQVTFAFALGVSAPFSIVNTSLSNGLKGGS